MFADFGTPPTADTTRSLVDERLKEQLENRGVTETLTIEWRDRPLHVPVIDVPLDALHYNPGTHRIRAQRSLDPDRDALLTADPWSPKSQDYLQHLLTIRPSDPDNRDPEFDKLKESLEEYKQIEPGLITREGIVVNGNTRCAALRELKTVTTMRVGVLPESCNWTDINDVEIALQLRPDRRRDYSYINRLLAIEELRIQLNRSPALIAKTFHTTTKACEQDLWVLAQLRELIERSTTTGGVSLRLVDFEDSKEKLRELHRVYMNEHAKSRERADLLKEARLAAIALGFSKTDVRYIESDFQNRYLDKALPDELKPAETAVEPASVAIPGLNRTVKGTGASVKSARAMTDRVLQAKAVESARGGTSPANISAASATISSYKGAFEDAIEVAGRSARLKKKRQAAPDRINDACKDLEQSITDLVLSRGSSSLDEGALDDALGNLRDVLGRLEEEAQRTVELPGDGVAWLSAAVHVMWARS